jgi:osmotically-inducible protein OsmY
MGVIRIELSLGFALLLATTACGRSKPRFTIIDAGRVGSAETTAAESWEDPHDIMITRDIRQDVMKDNNLSALAKNTKIITIDGVVSLRGAVKTADEKRALEALARAIPGVRSVDNQLEIEGQ